MPSQTARGNALKIFWGCLLAGLLAAAYVLLPSFLPKPERLNVLLIVADTLRADHLGVYGYPKNTSPNLDRFAARSVVFENAVAQGPWTKPSMGSLFTSTYPHNHSAMSSLIEILPKEVSTLTELLKKRGYDTLGIQTNPTLTKLFQFDQGFDVYEELLMPGLKETLVSRKAGEVVDHFFQWTDQAPRGGFFAYLHFMDCHLPFAPSEDDRRLFETSYEGSLLPDRIKYEQLPDILAAGPSLSEADKGHITALYDACIHYLDSQIGRLLDGLSERGLLDHTLVIIVADHGEELFEHGGFDHGQSLYNELLHVPLIVRYPSMGDNGVRIRQAVRLIDVFPTVLSFLHLPIPPQVLGTDLAALISTPETDRELPAYSEGISFHTTVPGKSPDDFISIRKGRYKLIQQKIYGKTVFEFYDLQSDPRETAPLDPEPALMEEYKALLIKHQHLGRPVRREALKDAEEGEAVRKLRSLGYLQ